MLFDSMRIFTEMLHINSIVNSSALGENRTHILSFGGLRAIRCTTRAG